MQELTVFLPERAEEIKQWFASNRDGRIVDEDNTRRVWRVDGGSPALYIKRFPTSLFRDRARREADTLRALSKAGIGCPRVVAHGKDREGHYVVTEELLGAESVRDVLAAGGPRVRPLLTALARYTRSLHDAGFEHPDLRVGNVLVREQQLFLIDVHRGSIRVSLSEKQRMRNIAFLLLSFIGFVRTTDLLRFLHAYGLAGPSQVREVHRRVRHHRHERFQSLQKRCTKKSRQVQIQDGIFVRRGVDAAQIHSFLARTDLRIVKETRKESLAEADGWFVKWTTRSRARRIWANSHGLAVRGIHTPKLLAYGNNWIVGEWLEAPHLYTWINENFDHMSRAKRDAFLAATARTLREIHLRGIYHRDLKASNVLVQEGGILLTDLDRVDFRKELSDRQRMVNLAQLNASLIPPLTRTDRLRFLHYYFAWEKACWDRRKTWISEIMRISIERNHYWPSKEA